LISRQARRKGRTGTDEGDKEHDKKRSVQRLSEKDPTVLSDATVRGAADEISCNSCDLDSVDDIELGGKG